MAEIADLLQQKTGMSQEQAQEVEQQIVQLIESKVPAQFQGVVGGLFGGSGQAQSSGLGGLLGMAEGLLGNK